MTDPDITKAQRAMEAMPTMKRIDIAAVERAAEGGRQLNAARFRTGSQREVAGSTPVAPSREITGLAVRDGRVE